MKYDVEIIKSKRRTLSLEIKSDGRIIARTPLRMSEREIRRFIESKEQWIENNLIKLNIKRQNEKPVKKLTDEEIKALNEKAGAYIPERVKYYADNIGVSYNKISIKPLRSKWGSCNSKGNLSFNSLLMLTPPEVIDSVVVHELCHRLEMNHSKAFYSYVLKAFPDYKRYNKWLKENGASIIGRIK